MKKFIAALLGIEIILFITNYNPGTFLVGWDNVMPEFNLWLNFQRSIFSLWQEYRGLGLIDGMAHSANLLHTVYIAFLGIFLPDSILRYLYIHITHLVGGIGIFFLSRKLLSLHKDSSNPIEENKNNDIAAFFTAVFYMFNIGIIQMYYAPLEVFATHFAALPILALTTYNALKSPTKKKLLLLFLSAFLLTPQAFVPTVFIAYTSILFFQLIVHLFSSRERLRLRFKTSLLVGITLFLANAFWLLPYAYSAITTPHVIADSRINEFSSEEIYYRNKARGDLLDTLTFKGFMLDSLEYDQQTSTYFQFMNIWNIHMNHMGSLVLSLLLSMIIVLGIILSIIRRNRKLYPFIGAFCIAFFFLANDTPVLAELNEFIRNTIPLVGEAFRFPFTKWITVFTFCASLFFGYIVSLLFSKKIIPTLVSAIIIGIGLLYLSYPVFQGYFTAPQLRLSIPNYYTQTFNYFAKQPKDARVALLPAETFWNWGYTSWGHRGSGFIWHGIPQALLTRAFDPWSLHNEQLYNELSYAQSTEDAELFARVLRKYDVHYLLVDRSILNSLSRQPINYEEMQDFLSKVPGLQRDKELGKIKIYKTDVSPSFLYTLNTKQTVKAYPPFLTSREDTINSLIGNYVITQDHPDIFTPFPSLSSDKLQEDLEMDIKENNSSITFTSRITDPISVTKANLIIPSYFQNEFLIPVTATITDNGVSLTPQYPSIKINNQNIEYPAKEIVLPTNLNNPTTISFPDINQTIPIDGSTQSYLIRTSATTIIISNGIQSETVVLDITDQDTSPFIISLPDKPITSFSLTIPKIQSPFSEENVLESNKYKIVENPNTALAYLENPHTAYTKQANSLSFSAQNSALELAFYKETLYHQASYISFIDSTYIQGLPVNFYIDNTFREKAILETKLSKTKSTNVILIPKIEPYFQGYGFHIITKSVGKEIAKANINRLSIYPAPLETIKRIRIADIASPVFAQVSADTKPLTYKKINQMYYTTQTKPNTYLLLSQSYNPGWKSYQINPHSTIQHIFPFLGTKLEKVDVNNWKNGWKIPESTSSISVAIIFLPLYIQLSGLLLTTIGLIFSFSTLILSFRKKLLSNK